jgi:hypothetical protein
VSYVVYKLLPICDCFVLSYQRFETATAALARIWQTRNLLPLQSGGGGNAMKAGNPIKFATAAAAARSVLMCRRCKIHLTPREKSVREREREKEILTKE